jgi:hypothetical protein
VARRYFSPGTPVSSTNKTDRHDITEILLKVVLSIIKPNLTHKSVSIKAVFWSVTVYNKYLSSQCNLTVRTSTRSTNNILRVNNISVISWRSVLLVEETGVPGEKYLLATSHYITYYYMTSDNVFSD